jgi:hypothetical protein
MPSWTRFVDSQIPIGRKRIERAMSGIEFFDDPALFALHSPASERLFGVVVEWNPLALGWAFPFLAHSLRDSIGCFRNLMRAISDN